jgi:hypothetical protein
MQTHLYTSLAVVVLVCLHFVESIRLIRLLLSFRLCNLD